MATNDFIISITGEINETETRRRIQEALARIVPNATINIQTTGTTQAVNDIDNVSRAIGTTAAVSIETVKQIENVVKKLIDTTEQLDKSITNIRIATVDTLDNTLDLMKELSANGQELGATTAEMSSGVETWLRQGKTLEQAQALTEETIKFSKVSKKSAEDSAKYLTALSKAYGIVDDEISQITDKLTAIDSNAAINAGALAEGMSKTAVTAKQAGVSMDELAGMITTVTEITQQSANSIGNAFKTIFTRMSDIKSSKLQLIDDDGTTELLSDVELTLKNVGIDLRATVNEYNSYSDVLSELAAKWDSLTQVQQNALSKAFAGTRQAETFRVLMENYENVSKYAEIAVESAGLSAEKFNSYLDSVEAKTKSLQAAFEGLTLDIVSPESIANVIDMTVKVTQFLDKTNLAKSALTGLAVGGAVSGLSSLAHVVGQAANSMSDFGNALRLASQGNLGTNEFSRLLNITNRLSASQLQAVLSTQSLTDAERMQILTNTGLSEAEARTQLQTMGLSATEAAATASTMSLSAAAKGLWATLAANPIGLIITAVTAGALAFNALKDAQEKAAEKAKEQAEQSRQNAETAKQESDNLSELIGKYKELAESDSFDNAETRSQVKDIQSDITKLVGQQANNLDLVNGALDDELQKLKEIEKQQRDKLIRDQRTAYIDSANEANNTTYHKGNSYMDWAYSANQITVDGDNGKIREQITKIVNKAFEDSDINATVNIQGTDFDKFLSFNFADNATLRDRVNGIETALQALENDTDFDTSTSELYRELSNAQKELQKVLDQQEQAANDLLETLTVSLEELKETLTDKTQVSSIEKLISRLEKLSDITVKADTDTSQTAQKQIEKNIKLIETEIDKIKDKKQAQEDYVKQLEKEKSELEELIDKYESAADTVKNAIDEQINGIEKQKDVIEDSYKKQTKAIEKAYEEQTELLQKQADAIDTNHTIYDSQIDNIDLQIKALRNEASEQDRLNKLKEKEAALEKAKNTKKRVYTGTGWRVESDSEAISKAQSEYDEALEEYRRESEIARLEAERDRLEREQERERERLEKERERLLSEKERLEKEKKLKLEELENLKEQEISGLEIEIEQLKEYRTQWEETVNAYKKAQDDMTAAALLGANWREEIANKDIGILNTFSANYQSTLTRLHDVIEPQITQAQSIVTAYNNEITKQNELKSTQQKYLDFYKTYSSDFAKATDKQREALEKLNKAIENNSGYSILSSLLESAENSFSGNSLIDKLSETASKNQVLYESIFNGTSAIIGTAIKNLTDSVTETGRDILESVKNDNRTSNVHNEWNVNNPVFDSSKNYEQFLIFANKMFNELDMQTKIGKR